MSLADVVVDRIVAMLFPVNTIIAKIKSAQPSVPTGARGSLKEFSMKRIWRTWLAIFATASMTATASGQQNGNQPNDLGSYQSIMSRAGVQQGGYELSPPTQPMQPRNGQMIQNGIQNGHVIGNGYPSYDQGMGYGVAPGNCSAPAYGAAAPMSGAGTPANCAVNAPVGGQSNYFDAGCADNAIGCAVDNGSSAHWVVGTRTLFFTRNGESAVPLSRSDNGTLLSTVNDYGTMPGGEVTLTRRSCSNRGLEFRYWGLYPSGREYTLWGPNMDTYLTGLNYFAIPPTATNVLDYYNNSDSHRVYRNNDFYSAEINALRNGGCYTAFGCRSGNYELLGGFRWIQFNEDYRFSANYPSANPTRVDYDLATRNTLLGFQLGGRNELCLTDRISLLGGTRVGLFNNHSESRQSIRNEFGQFAYLETGTAGVDDYNYSGTRNSLAMLGELDLGIACRLTQRVRANVGYRLVGLSGIALAPNQIPRNFLNTAEINRVNSNDSLILGGGYAGMDVCF
jgi:hypothetical protein